MEREHDDGNWTCNDCDFQTNKTETLRQHLKKTGHQPSEATRRQTNEIRKCYTCKEEFEGYISMMNHRFNKHPSNNVCKNLPTCTGWVNSNKCWYVHPVKGSDEGVEDTDINKSVELEKDTECRRCGKMFTGRNRFMEHYTSEHTSRIVCRDWVKNNCKRVKCWYRHSHLQPTEQSSSVRFVPTSQDFPPIQPPPQPPAPARVTAQSSVLLQPNNQAQINQMLAQMTLRMNTLELGITESRNQMHILQQMLS